MSSAIPPCSCPRATRQFLHGRSRLDSSKPLAVQLGSELHEVSSQLFDLRTERSELLDDDTPCELSQPRPQGLEESSGWSRPEKRLHGQRPYRPHTQGRVAGSC